jgi:spore coat protein CotH
MKGAFAIILFLYLSIQVGAQTFTESNLPIVVITTDIDPNTGLPIPISDDPKVYGTMKIIYRPDGTRNYLTDINTTAFINYSGRIKIETRGSTSQTLPKKPYGLTTILADNSNNNVSLLGMPIENDWILNSLAFEATLLRDYFTYELAREMGNYASRGKYCEVLVNGNYRGLYVLMEKIKADDNRVNIVKLTNLDTDVNVLSGGYITKADKTTGNDPVAWSMNSTGGGTTDYIHHSPAPELITIPQANYIYDQFISLRDAASVGNISITDGYPSMIDIPSFVDFMLLNELASNVDGYQFSTYFHKDRNAKLRAGPIWDFNLTYGNDLTFWGLDRSHTDVWQFNNGDNTGSNFWFQLFNNATFKCYLTKRWKELTASGKTLEYVVMSAKIDAIVAQISEASVREEMRWGNVGNHAIAISDMKNWLQTRITWMNAQLTDDAICTSIELPPIVISKIHYHPPNVANIAKNDLEFIELTNTSANTVDMTGVYFREPGLNFSFPENASIGSNEKIYLVSNTSVFQNYYGLTAYGQFTRNLPNSTHKLILADAFGNIIDYVKYEDVAPWPTQADGAGYWLQLIDVSYNNSLASSWTAGNQLVNSTVSNVDFKTIIFPNPVQNTLHIVSSQNKITSYELFDLTGKSIKNAPTTEAYIPTIDVESLPINSYFLKLNFENGNHFLTKIVKN